MVIAMPEIPFINEEEYRHHVEKEESINVWAQHILETIAPYWCKDNEVYEVWEGDNSSAGRLIIDYSVGHETEQAWVPIACLWSKDWEKLNEEAKEEASRQWREKEEKRLFEKLSVTEADERAWLAQLKKKYPDTTTEM